MAVLVGESRKRQMAALTDRHLRAFSVGTAPINRSAAMPAGSTLARDEVDRRVLASSINFDVEFDLIAFVEARHARTLNRADVHERIRLTVIARDEAEALHRVEELDRTGRLVTRQLALRSRFARCLLTLLFDRDDIADHHEIAGRNLAATIDELKFQLLTFGKTFQAGTLYRADVHEHIIATLIALNEAEALGCVEELYDALALANDLGRHAAATGATAAETAAATTGTAAETATAGSATTEAAATAAKAITTAEAAAVAATAEAITAAKAAATATVLSCEEGIEAAAFIFAKPIALVTSPTATSSIKTHLYE